MSCSSRLKLKGSVKTLAFFIAVDINVCVCVYTFSQLCLLRVPRVLRAPLRINKSCGAWEK